MNTTDKILEELDVLIEVSLKNSNPIGATLCDARRTIADYRARIAEFWDALDALRSERDEAREDLEFRRGLYKFQEEHLEAARRERDEARVERDRLAVALRECRDDSIELLGERDWWQRESRGDYQERYQANRDNIERADEALQSLNQPEL